MSNYEYIVSSFREKVNELNTTLLNVPTKLRNEALNFIYMDPRNGLICNHSSGDITYTRLNLNTDSDDPNYLTIKSFDLMVNHELSESLASNLSISGISECLDELNTLHQRISKHLPEQPKEPTIPAEILHHWDGLLEDLNRVAYGYNWDEVAEPNTYTIDSFAKRAISINISFDFKIVFITNEHDSRGKPIASVQIQQRNANCERSLIEGYLIGIPVMIKLTDKIRDKIRTF